MYRIVFSNEIIIDNLKRNGNNYISEEVVNIPDVILDATVYDLENGGIEIFKSIKVQPVASDPGEYNFVLVDISKTEIQYAKNRADIEYLAMMMDLEL